MDGWIDPENGRYALRARVVPGTYAVHASRSGIVGGRLETYRTVLTRHALLGRFSEIGELDKDRRGVTGTRSFVQEVRGPDRNVTINWSLERMDPVVRGRVVDGGGKPVKGVLVRATAPGGGRMMVRSGESGDDGNFEIPCVTGFWRVFTNSLRENDKEGVVLVAASSLDPVGIKFAEVPTLEVTVTRYRLAKLPLPHLLRRRFSNDVDKYLAHLRKRAPQVVLGSREIK